MESQAEAITQGVEVVEGIRTVSQARLDALADERGVCRRELELAALSLEIMPLRYLRNHGTIGTAGQRTLLESSVAIVGLGGLGGYVLEGLARMGVGRLTLVDGDTFCDHNLNRQLLALEAGVGSSKTSAAAERVAQVNSSVESVVFPFAATPENLPRVLDGVQVLVDAVDRLSTRLMLQNAAREQGIPMVHGAIGGWMGQVMTVLPGDVGLRGLYGVAEDGPDRGAEAELGTPAASPMMVAAWQVHETVKLLLGRTDLLRDRMLFLDAETNQARVLGL